MEDSEKQRKKRKEREMKKILWTIFVAVAFSACGEAPVVEIHLQPASNDPRVYCGTGTIMEDGFCVVSEEDDGVADNDAIEIEDVDPSEFPPPEQETVVLGNDDDSYAVVAEEEENCDGQPMAEKLGQPCYSGGSHCVPSGDTYSCFGVCRPGVRSCIHGMIDCVGEVQPTDEICDGQDNNCDGRVDEGCGENTFEILSVTVEKLDALGNPAEDVRRFGVTFSSPAKDIDFAIFNDQTGQMFYTTTFSGPVSSLYISPGDQANKLEPNTTYRYGVTANAATEVVGQQSDSFYGTFTTSNFSEEICDGMDNDGDGEVDEEEDLYSPEGFLCAVTSEGVSQQGRYVCVPDNFGHAYFQCQLDCQPEEKCGDGLDNDCDGEEDEGCAALLVSLNPASPNGFLVSGNDTLAMIFDFYAKNTVAHIEQFYLSVSGTCGDDIKITSAEGITLAGPAKKSTFGDVYFTDAIYMSFDSVSRQHIYLDTTDCTESGDWIEVTIVDIQTEEELSVENLPLVSNVLVKP